MVGEIRNHSLPEAFIVTQVAPSSADGDHVSKAVLESPSRRQAGQFGDNGAKGFKLKARKARSAGPAARRLLFLRPALWHFPQFG